MTDQSKNDKPTPVAQLVEQRIPNPQVAGSSPSRRVNGPDKGRGSSFGLYKLGQGYWVRMLTAIAVGVLFLATAAWAWRQVEALPLPTPTWSFTVGEVARPPAAGDTVTLVSTATQPATDIGTAVVSSYTQDEAESGQLIIGSIQMTEEYSPVDARRLRIKPVGGTDIVAPVIAANGIALFEIIYLQAGLAAGILIIGAFIIYWYVGAKPSAVEFLIATDGEMRKVNWSTKKNIKDSTLVVISATFLIAGVIFLFDFVLAPAARAIGLVTCRGPGPLLQGGGGGGGVQGPALSGASKARRPRPRYPFAAIFIDAGVGGVDRRGRQPPSVSGAGRARRIRFRASFQGRTPAAINQFQPTPRGDSMSEQNATKALDGTPNERGDLIKADEVVRQEGMNWFVLRVASNKESSVRETLLRKVQIEGMTHLVGRILVPTEKTKTIKAGKQKITETKLYPGYVFVEMRLEDDGRIPQDVFFLIKETTGVGDFVGTAGRPTAMKEHEIEKMLKDSRKPEDEPTVKLVFNKGEHVRIKEGPFEGYEGTVDELDPEKGRVRVLVTIFGRQAPIELEEWQLGKAEEV